MFKQEFVNACAVERQPFYPDHKSHAFVNGHVHFGGNARMNDFACGTQDPAPHIEFLGLIAIVARDEMNNLKAVWSDKHFGAGPNQRQLDM